MRILLGTSAVALLLLMATFSVGLSACTKEITALDTVIVVQKDTTVQIKIDTVRLVKNTVPIVNAGSDTEIRLSAGADSLRLNGSATDPDDLIVSYLWSQVSGPNTALITDPGSALTYVTKLASGTYVFQLMAVDNDGAVGVKRISLNVSAPQLYTLTLQPGAEGQDAIVAVRATDGGANASANHNYAAEVGASEWTYNAQNWGEGTNRSYLKFTGLSAVPAGAEIVSAKLSLYGLSSGESVTTPQGNSYYPGSPYVDTNPGWIKLVTGGDWDETTITWNNKPATTNIHEAEIPVSTSQYNYNATDIDVRDLVKDIESSGHNYGFCLQMQTEQIYRALVFASSEYADSTKRPKLVVEYLY